jgi:putative transposase
MSQTLSPSFARSYGLARVARVWDVSRAGVYRFFKEIESNTILRRPGPIGACSDAELADHIRRQITGSGFHGEGYRKIWARLRVDGVRASPRRVRRVMREHGLLAPHRAGRAQAKAHDGTIVTDTVNEMWGTDMTQTITVGEGRAYVFVAVEHANSEIVGIHAARSANRFEALEPVRQGVHRCFGAIAPGVAHGLKLRHDHGSNYMSGDFQDEIECLGISGHRSLALLCARTRGQWRRRTLHTNLEGEPAVGGDLRHNRRAAHRAHRVRQTLQRKLARRAAWIQNTGESERGANHATTRD